MNKEPIGLYAFRFFLAFGLFAFMMMLYWSSLLLEEQMHEVKTDLAEIKAELSTIQEEISTLHLEAPLGASSSQKSSSKSSFNESSGNILKEDLFYQTTLPNLLEKGFKPRGAFQLATVGRPENLHPFSNWQNVSAWHDQCSLSVSRLQFGKYETFAPDMATKMELHQSESKDAVEYLITLQDHVYWQPLLPKMFENKIELAPHFLKKHKVTAHDFKFYVDAIKNPFVQQSGAVALRTYLDDLEDIIIIDDLNFIARWKGKEVMGEDGKSQIRAKYVSKQMTGALRPLASFVYQYFPNGKKIIEEDADPETYRTNSVFAQNFQQHWAQNIIPSCGPWIFESMTEREIRFKRNPNYYNALSVLVDASTEEFKISPTAVWQDFKSGRLDSYVLQPGQLVELSNFMQSPEYKQQAANGNGIEKLEYISRSYSYIGWNMAKPFFKSKKVRQALTMAIDRQRIINQYLNGMGVAITGPFYPYSPSHNAALKPWPFDLDAARHLLQEEGWFDKDGDGIIEKIIEGKSVPFQFSLTYYVQNPTTKAIAEYISTTLKELGILCNLNGVEVADLTASFEDKSFDAITMGWSLGTPPEEIGQLWSSSGAKEKGSSNAVGFENKEVDAIIEKLDYTFEPKERIKLYHRFEEIIYDECPYTFLYTPKTVFLYRPYIKNVWIPAERQDLIPGANIAEPDSSIFWIDKHV